MKTMGHRLGIWSICGGLAVTALLAGWHGPAQATVRASAAAARSPRELDTALALFERFNPALLRANRPATVGGRRIQPRLTPLRFDREDGSGDFVTHLAGGLAWGEINELQLSLETDWAFPPELRLPALNETSLAEARGTERLIDSTALVEGGVQRATDALVRPLPLGLSLYLQFRSPAAPERVVLSNKFQCPPLNSEVVRRLGPGTFAIEGLSRENVECEPYSRALLPVHAPPPPSDTVANYRHERRLLAAALRRARADHATLLAVVNASSARDAAGHPVPTDFAWRRLEEPVLRVHHERGERYPVLARVDFIVEPARGR